MRVHLRHVFYSLPFFAFLIVLSSCGGSKNEQDELSDERDTIKTTVLNVSGELFSIPSPAQTAMLVQKSGINYDKTMLSEAGRVNTFNTDFIRAINLGIYGADLGYVSLYNQTQDAIAYLAAVKQLSDKLGVSMAFDKATMTRLQNNLTNRDSMMVLVSLAYQASDTYLKNNQRNDLSSLILAGGWLEGMHFSVTANKTNPSEQLRYRIAEQKQALQSILKVMAQNNSFEAKELSSHLRELYKIYEGVVFKYKYEAPETDSLKKVTYINCTTEITMSDEQLTNITNKIEEIRTKLMNTSK